MRYFPSGRTGERSDQLSTLEQRQKTAAEAQRLAAAVPRAMPLDDVLKELRRIADALERAFPLKHTPPCPPAPDLRNLNASVRHAPPDPRYCAGSSCNWHGTWSRALMIALVGENQSDERAYYPRCPHCQKAVAEFPSRDQFMVFARIRVAASLKELAHLKELVDWTAEDPVIRQRVEEWLSTSPRGCIPFRDFALQCARRGSGLR